MTADKEGSHSGSATDRVVAQLSQLGKVIGALAALATAIGTLDAAVAKLSGRDSILYKVASVGVQAAPEAPPKGWIYVGNVSSSNPAKWADAEQGRVEIYAKSPEADRPYPVRVGDLVKPREGYQLPLEIINYHITKYQYQPVDPITATNELHRVVDHSIDDTGIVYQHGDELRVEDVVAGASAGRDAVLWLNVSRVRATPATSR